MEKRSTLSRFAAVAKIKYSPPRRGDAEQDNKAAILRENLGAASLGALRFLCAPASGTSSKTSGHAQLLFCLTLRLCVSAVNIVFTELRIAARAIKTS
jgi:hypothetical protein